MHTMTTRAPKAPQRSWRPVAAVIAIAFVAGVAFFVMGGLVRSPDVIPRIEIDNQTADLVDVLARGDDDHDLMPVAVVEPQRRGIAEDVVDQGDHWTFVVEASGRPVTTIRLSRDELVQAGWVLTIPASPDNG